MKRLAVFVLLGPILFVLCVWFVFLPLAIRTEGGSVRYNFEVDFRLLLGLMFGCFVLALTDWVAELLVMRPWFTAAVGWVIGSLTLGVFNLSEPIWWWFIVKGLLVGIPVLVCSWLVKRLQNRSAR